MQTYTALPGMFRDCLIENLSPSEYETANETARSWFESPGFATLYGTATHALVARPESGQTGTMFYRVDRCLGFLRRIQFIGPVHLTEGALENVMSMHCAQLATIPLMGHDFKYMENRNTRYQRSWKVARQGEDIVIQIPPTMEEYLSGLGKQTRKHLPYYVRRLEREWGSQLRFGHLETEQIELADFQCLVALNRARMRQKWKRSGWTEHAVYNRWLLARCAGLFTGVYRESQLVAGTICYLHRDELFLALIAHDPIYDALNLGSVALTKTLEQAIATRCRYLHLLWGRGFYKHQFGGGGAAFVRGYVS